MGQRSADRPTDAIPSAIDYPGSILNVAALLCVVVCLASAFLRILSGHPLMPVPTYASLTAIEVTWLVDQAILISGRN